MTEDRSDHLEGELLPGDCAEAQIHFILINHLLFREVVREHPRSKPILVANIIIRVFGLPELHRRALQTLRGIARDEKRAIQTELEKLLVTNRGRPPKSKQRGTKSQNKAPAAAAKQPTVDLQPAPQTPSAPQAPLERPREPIIQTPPAGPTVSRPKLRSMVNQLNLPREITSLLHSYLFDASDDELRAALKKIPMPWQGYNVPDDVRAALKYVDALG